MEEVKQQTTETALSLMNKLENTANSIVDKLIEISPQALDTILNIRRLEGLSELIPSLIYLSFFITLLVYIYKKVPEWNRKADWVNENKEAFLVIGSAALSGVSSVLLLVNFISLVNFWNWVAVFAPELSIAKDIMDGVLGK